MPVGFLNAFVGDVEGVEPFTMQLFDCLADGFFGAVVAFLEPFQMNDFRNTGDVHELVFTDTAAVGLHPLQLGHELLGNILGVLDE